MKSETKTTLKYAVQDQLGKLLAMEDIEVMHGNFETASFNPSERILRLPIWKDVSNDTYRMLLAHEVGHALFTPDRLEELQKRDDLKKIPFAIFNIVEDIRIEQKMQKKYPGTISSFIAGYKELHTKNFFKINKEFEDYGFFDRINLKWKLQNLENIPMSIEESDLYNEGCNLETFDDVIEFCKKLYDFEKNKEEQPKQEEQEESGQESSGQEQEQESSGQEQEQESSGQEQEQESSGQEQESSGQEEQEESGQEESGQEQEQEESGQEEQESSGQEQERMNNTETDGDGEEVKEPETTDSFNESLKENTVLDDNTSYLNKIPFKKFKKTIKTWKDLRAERTKEYENMFERSTESEYISEKMFSEYCGNKAKFAEWMKEKEKVAIQIWREFERKKSAWEYSRSSVAKTGNIDVNKLHKFKFDDQLFKSISVNADGKNHGLVFFLDWSGSMNYQAGDMITQLSYLTIFCRKAKIPFEVYTFTSLSDDKSLAIGNTIDVRDLTIIKQLDSNMNEKEFKETLFYLYINANNKYFSGLSEYDRMGGTPTIETLLYAVDILEEFVSANNIQKLTTMILSDGEPNMMRALTSEGKSTFLRNKAKLKLKNKYIDFGGCTLDIAMMLTKELSNMIPNNNVIGFFLPNHKRDLQRKIAKMASVKTSDYKAELKKNGVISADNEFGYDTFFVLPTENNTNEDQEFEFDTTKLDMNKKGAQNKLARHFSKFNSEKKKKRIFVNLLTNKIA